MIRAIILGTILAIAGGGAIYLMAAFYSLDLNFAHWTADTRMGCVAGFMFVLLMVTVSVGVAGSMPYSYLPPPPPPPRAKP